MDGKKKVCLIIGSPKDLDSTSFTLGQYMIDDFKQKGMKEIIYTATEINNSKNGEAFSKILECNIVIISVPLYVDSLPAPVIKMLENFAEFLEETNNNATRPILLGIVNSGFPEAERCYIAIKNLEIFSSKNNFAFAGGIPVGGGAVIAHRNLKRMERYSPQLLNCLKCVANDIFQQNTISDNTIKLTSTSLIPEKMKEVVYFYINKMCE